MKHTSVFYFFIGAFFACCLFFRFCHSQKNQKSTEGYYVDTVRISDTIHLPAPIVREKFLVAVPVKVDTQAILQDYFTRNVYMDTLVNTPDLSVVVRDTVAYNLLSGRGVYYTVSQPVYIEKKNGISLSSTFGYKSIPVLLNYERSEWRISAGYDVVHKTPFFGLGYRFVKW